MGYQLHYAKLFEELQLQFGTLDANTTTWVIGFAAGGPVSMVTRKDAKLFATCELSVYEEQRPSTEGVKFELFCMDDFDEGQAQTLLTALGALSMQAQLGDRHAVDACQISGTGVKQVRLHLFSTAEIEGIGYGLYRVRPA